MLQLFTIIPIFCSRKQTAGLQTCYKFPVKSTSPRMLQSHKLFHLTAAYK